MEPSFDHEKLDVYRLELEFVAWTAGLLREVAKVSEPMLPEIRNQLGRSCLSSLLNTAEGNEKRQRPIRSKFFDDARGSAMESAGCLDALAAVGAVRADRIL